MEAQTHFCDTLANQISQKNGCRKMITSLLKFSLKMIEMAFENSEPLLQHTGHPNFIKKTPVKKIVISL